MVIDNLNLSGTAGSPGKTNAELTRIEYCPLRLPDRASRDIPVPARSPSVWSIGRSNDQGQPEVQSVFQMSRGQRGVGTSPLCRWECNNLFSRPQYCVVIEVNPMTLTLELPPDLEAGLVAHARAEGLSPEIFVQHLLRDQVSVPLPEEMTPAQRAQAWRDSVIGLPWTPPLSDEAISRESMYGDRG